MVNETIYFEELQKILGETKSADEINDRWNEVLVPPLRHKSVLVKDFL